MKPRWMNRDIRATGTTKDEVHDRTDWTQENCVRRGDPTMWARLDEEEEEEVLTYNDYAYTKISSDTIVLPVDESC